MEIDVRIERHEIAGRFLQLGLHLVHVLVALLDDGKCHGTLTVRQGQAPFLLRYHRHLAEVLQLHQALPFPDVDVLHVFRCTEKGGYADVVLVITVAYQHASRLHIVGSQSIFNVGNGDSRNGKFLLVRNNLKHPSRYPGNVCHRHFGQLLDASLHHIFRQFAEVQEALFVRFLVSPVLLQGHVQVQHGDVRCTRLDRLGAFCFLRQAVHGGIYLFVHFDERQIGVHPEIEFQTDDARTVAGLALDFTESGYLKELSAYRSYYRILQLACR